MTNKKIISDETRKKISEARIGKKHSEETKQKLIVAWTRRPPMSEETKLKLSIAGTGKILSPEHRKKISNARKGLAFTEEHKANLKRARGHTKRYEMTNEIRQHIGQSQIGKIYSDDTKQKIGNASRGRVHSEEHRKKMSDAIKKEKHPNWQGGKSYEPYCQKFDNHFKERVRAFFGYICPECGTPQNGTKLAVHHVNFRKDSCCNPDAPRLFIPLCPSIAGKSSCHNKTNHNRNYWEQHFTDMILGYYQGKCYFTESEMASFAGGN